MTDDEIIDALYNAVQKHEAAKAGQGDYNETYKACALAERALLERGLRDQYKARYPRSGSGW